MVLWGTAGGGGIKAVALFCCNCKLENWFCKLENWSNPESWVNVFSWKLNGEQETVFSDEDIVVCCESEIGDSDLDAEELVVSELVNGEYFLCNVCLTLAVFMTGWDFT